jgi:hypothetical protein
MGSVENFFRSLQPGCSTWNIGNQPNYFSLSQDSLAESRMWSVFHVEHIGKTEATRTSLID